MTRSRHGAINEEELWGLLEFIKGCYPICDTETFAQRVVSRLSEIVPKEIIPHNVASLRTEPNAYLPHPHAAYTPDSAPVQITD